MGSVYRTSEGNLVLYTQEDRIYLRTLVKEGMGRAVILASDYDSDLTDVLYRGNVYYAYKNTEGKILVRNISDHGVWYRLGEEGGLEGYAPRLSTVGDILILFYAMKNPLDGTYYLRCRMPEAPDKERACLHLFENMGIMEADPPMIQTISCIGGMLLVVDPERMIWWDEEGNGGWIAKSDRQKQETLRVSFQEKLDQKDQIIESIKQQYEELMKVAETYRQEAIKWRNKFLPG